MLNPNSNCRLHLRDVLVFALGLSASLLTLLKPNFKPPAKRLTQYEPLTSSIPGPAIPCDLDRTAIVLSEKITDIVVNVGPNNGPVLSSGPHQLVIAIEPSPDPFCAIKDWENTWSIPAGAATKRGVRAFNLMKNSASSSFVTPPQTAAVPQLNIISQTLVPIIRLDDLLSILPTPDNNKLTYSFLKIDAQGYDYGVLQGAGDYIKRFCTIECEAQVGTKGSTAMGTASNTWNLQRAYLETKGFAATRFECHDDVPGALEFVPKDLPRTETGDVYCSYDLNIFFRNTQLPGICP